MRYFLVCFNLFCTFSSLAQFVPNKLSYDMPLEQLQDIRLKNNQENYNLLPSFEMSLEELTMFRFVMIAKEANQIEFGYDLDLEELSMLEFNKSEEIFIPSFGMDINALTKLSLKKMYVVNQQLDFAYDLPIETLTKLTVID